MRIHLILKCSILIIPCSKNKDTKNGNGKKTAINERVKRTKYSELKQIMKE